MTSHYEIVKNNWSLFRANKITLVELLERNNKLVFRLEIAELVPHEVKSAMKVMGGSAVLKSEHGSPPEKL